MSGHTPGPWVQFADQGRVVAIMPAGRPGDVACFAEGKGPSEADARVMTASPLLLDALASFVEDWRRAWREQDERIRLEVTPAQFRAAEAALKAARGGLALVRGGG